MGCVSQSNKIEQALVLSGENRPALERVLQHYSQRPADSLKYQAALFLIENMPGHYKSFPIPIRNINTA